MNKIFFITGPAGVGKTTVSRQVAEQLEKSVLLEGDSFYHHVVSSYVPAWKEGNHLDTFWKVCTDTIITYLNAGYDVVFNYIIEYEKFNELKEIFKDYDTKFIVLITDEKTLLERDKLREEDCRMNDRCLVLLEKFLKSNFDAKFLLDTSNMTSKQATEVIVSENRFLI